MNCPIYRRASGFHLLKTLLLLLLMMGGGLAARADLTAPIRSNSVAQAELAGSTPLLTQGDVSGLGTTSATLNGLVNPNGLVTTAQFEYGLTDSYDKMAPVTLSPNDGTVAQNVSATLTGLNPETTYFYRLTATNGDGTESTSGGAFTTQSSNADLSSLTLSSGTLSPDFASATTSYTASVVNAVSAITVTPEGAQPAATIQVRINGGGYVSVSSASESGMLALNAGANPVEVQVTAQDGTLKTYTVTVTRPALSPLFSSSTDVPVTSDGYGASGALSVTLGFAPAPLQVLVVVNNIGTNPIGGTFAGLAEGATVTATYGGNTFVFQISYLGGDGNDITLTRRVGTAGQVTNSNIYAWSTLAGSVGQRGSADGTGSGASFDNLTGVAVDSAGNLYVADYFNQTIRKITAGGVVTTLAGEAGQSGSLDDTGSAARFNYPTGVAVDSARNVYVADTYNSTIRKITPGGVVTTLAGEAGQNGSTNGTGDAARFYNPTGVAADGAGNVYVADIYNSTIRKITPGGAVTTLAGSAGETGSTDGPGDAAKFYYPSGVAVDGAGNVYVADTYNSTLRKITPGGVVTTLAGSAGETGSTDGPGDAARFYYPSGVAVDSAGHVFVADSFNHTIRKITAGGVVSTVGGSAGMGGSEAGYGGASRFLYPEDVEVSPTGMVYAVDQNHRVAQGQLAGFMPFVTQGAVSDLGETAATLNGTVNPNGFVTTAQFEYGLTASYGSTAPVSFSPNDGTAPQNVSVTLTGLDLGTRYYYRLTATNVDGTQSTSGGTFATRSSNADLSSLTLSSGTLSPSFASATTSYTASVANVVSAIAVTPTTAQPAATIQVRINGGSYVSVSSASESAILALNAGANPVEVQVTATDGTLKTYTVTVTRPALSPLFSTSTDVPVTSDGYNASGALSVTLGFAPTPGQRLLVVNNTGTSAIDGTFAGLAEGATVTVTYGGNTFAFQISYLGGDGNDITLTRGVGTAGQVTNSKVYAWSTLAGSVGQPGSADGPASAARFNSPKGVAVDSAGNLYVADYLNQTIRKITAGGVVTTLAGSAGQSGSLDETGGTARFNFPTGVAVDSAGNVYVTDYFNQTIRKITAGGVVTTLAGSAGQIGSTNATGDAARFYYPTGVAVDSAGNLHVADTSSSTIRKITPGGAVTTPAGSAGQTGSTNATGSAARFNFPTGVAVDSAGNVYVADTFNSTIRKMTPGGVVTTLAGSAGQVGSTNGPGDTARFYNPSGVAVDGAGTLFVTDSFNHTIRKITAGGVVSTIGGSAGVPGSEAGYGGASRFLYPEGVAVSSTGVVYVVDQNHRVAQGQLAGFLPFVTLGGASGLGSTGATLNGTVNPNGFVTTARFEYGPTVSYGSTAPVSFSPNDGTAAQNVSATLAGLSPGTVYYYRLTATNVDGTESTSGGSFTTQSSNADLSSLTLSSGRLSPAFASATTTYTANASNAVSAITVTPTAAHPAATIQARFNGGPYGSVSSASESGIFVLNAGVNTIEVQVTAQDGTLKTYTVAVTPLIDPVVTVLALKGAPVPRAGLDANIPSGAVWVSFGVPSINEAGQVAFLGTFEAGSVTSTGIFAGSLQAPALLVKKGAAALGVDGAVFSAFKDPVLAPDGAVAFAATLENAPGRSVVTATSDSTLWLDSDGAGPQGAFLVAREGTPGAAFTGVGVSGNYGQWKGFTSLSLGDGALAFTATLLTGPSGTVGPGGVTPSTDTGLWIYDRTGGTLALPLREGDGFKGSPVETIATLVGRAGSLGQGRGVAGLENGQASDEVTVRVGLADGRQTLGHVDSASNQVILPYLARTKAAAFNAARPPTWASFGVPTQNLDGALAFIGAVKAGTGSATSANNVAIFAEDETAGFAAAAVVMKGQVAAESGGGVFAAFLDPVSGVRRSVAFIGTLALNAAKKVRATNDTGIWWRDPAGDFHLVAREGALPAEVEAVAVPAGVAKQPKWKAFTSLAMPDSGRGPLFVGTMVNATKNPVTGKLLPGPGGVTADNDVGLWALDGKGQLRLLVREGDDIGGRTLRSFTVLAAVTGSPAQTRSFNGAGQVLYRAFFKDGSQGLVVVQVP